MKTLSICTALLGLAGLSLALSAAPGKKATKPDKATLAEYYTVEKIETPPGLSVEVGGIDFLPNGKLVACFHRGEVYLYDPAKKTWALFAEGLHDPLGVLAVSNSEILVMQRPELTRLRDTDGDGVADDYQTVTDAYGLSGNYHEFAFGPVKDKLGNLFIALNVGSNGSGIRNELRGEFNPRSPLSSRMYSAVPWRGWVMKLTPDGKLTPYAAGFRSPNGLGFDADGNLWVPDNQGDWIGTSPLYRVEAGKFYGHIASLAWQAGETRETTKIPIEELDAKRTRGSVLFPQGIMANSPTQPLLDSTGGKFGPFAGQMLMGDHNRSRVMHMMMETVDGQVQGACAPAIDGGIPGGVNRLAFAPDGALWVGHTSHGWGASTGISRVKWTGKMPLDVQAMHLTKKGFTMTFTKPVQEATATLPATYHFKRYYYEYHPTYGAPQGDLEEVPVTAATLSPDRKTVTVEFANLKAWRVYELNIDGLRDDEGAPILNPLLCYTVNHLLENTPPPPPPGRNVGDGKGGKE